MSIFSDYVIDNPDLNKNSDAESECLAAIDSGDWRALDRSYDVSDEQLKNAVKIVSEYIEYLQECDE